MIKFICIGGKAQNGKDTTAGMIKENLENRGFKVLIIHYADLLKYICKQYFGWNGEKDDTGRTLLQRVGTEVVRKKCPDYWVDFVLGIAKMFPDDWDYIIIPDTRFPNELDKIKKSGYTVHYIRVRRADFRSPLSEEQQNHPSETALDMVKPDILVLNRTLDELKQDTDNICDTLVVGKKREIYEQLTFDDILGGE